MPFRDRTPVCPRCQIDLERAEDEREAWHCSRCAGTALGVGDLIDDLLDVAPHLRPADRVRDVVTVSRRATAHLPCPACGKVMEPVYLGAVEIERCRADNLVWLERGERGAVIARARTQPRPGHLGHLRDVLLEPPADRKVRTWPKRIATIASLLAVLAALPIGLFGVLLVAIGSSSTGLDAIAAPAGWIVVAVAAIMFLVGGIVFVRAAR
jgi:Zn-finger nucleic acid-binding protein